MNVLFFVMPDVVRAGDAGSVAASSIAGQEGVSDSTGVPVQDAAGAIPAWEVWLDDVTGRVNGWISAVFFFDLVGIVIVGSIRRIANVADKNGHRIRGGGATARWRRT